MRLIRNTEDTLLLEISTQERVLLLHTLKLYPMVPVTHHRLSKDAQSTEHQQLLEQSLLSQQQEHQKHLASFIEDPGRFRAAKKGFQLSLNRMEVEWLLQVLNDVRVGSWLALGSPEDEVEGLDAGHDPEQARYTAAMHLAGAFQHYLVEALNQG